MKILNEKLKPRKDLSFKCKYPGPFLNENFKWKIKAAQGFKF